MIISPLQCTVGMHSLVAGSQFTPQPSQNNAKFSSNPREKQQRLEVIQGGLGLHQCVFRTPNDPNPGCAGPVAVGMHSLTQTRGRADTIVLKEERCWCCAPRFATAEVVMASRDGQALEGGFAVRMN